MPDIAVDTPADGVIRLTLNRPDALNALTYAMYDELIAHFEAVRFDASIRAVILTGTGRGFCAGHDVRAAGEPGWICGDLGKQQRARAIMARISQVPCLMRSLPQPIICGVNGAVAGAGYSLALAADLCIAARSARFVNAFHNAATGHELGISYMLPRAIGTQRAAEILLTGRSVPAKEAARIGMVLRVVDDGALMEECLSLASAIALNSPIGIAITKQSLWLNGSAGSLEHAIELENRGIAVSQATSDAGEKRASFLEGRKPDFMNK